MSWKKLLSLFMVLIPAIIDLLDGDDEKKALESILDLFNLNSF